MKFQVIKTIILLCMIASVGAMMYFNTNTLVLLAAFFTLAFFLIWVQENVISFLLWKKNNAQEMKKDFEIFRLYAEKFVELFCKNHNDRR